MKKRGQFQYRLIIDGVQEVECMGIGVGMGEGDRGEDFLCNDE